MSRSLAGSQSLPTLSTKLSRDGSAPMPNMPGFRQNKATASATGQSLRLVHGHMIVNSRPQTTGGMSGTMTMSSAALRATSPTRGVDASGYYDLGGRYSIRSQSKDRTSKMHHLPYGAESQLPNFLKFDRKVLCFDAFYTEPVYESAQEKDRVRKCVIYLYLEDGTIQMVEHQQENSGIPQGAFIRRHQIPKPPSAGGGGFYTEHDLYVGATLNVYNKVFEIYDCNDSTRAFLAQDLMLPPDKFMAAPHPEGEYNSMLRSKMQRETGADLSIKRNRKMHPMKMFMEAQLGKPQSAVDLGSFLANDRKVLRFDCVWDDTSRLYGDVLQFKLHYFLSDDTMEILQVHTKNNGRDLVPKLLNRSRLPKQPRMPTQGNGESKTSNEPPDGDQMFHWTDITIGTRMTVFNRTIVVLDADPFTRSFFAKEGSPLAVPRAMEAPASATIDKAIPPHSGFGSEEDSLQSVYSIRPQPPKKDMKKLHELSGQILRFQITLASSSKEDLGRLFVLMFHLEDDTIAVREPPTRNSGHMGGNFLARTRIAKPDGSGFYGAADLVVGAEINILTHKFIISHADNYTLARTSSQSVA